MKAQKDSDLETLELEARRLRDAIYGTQTWPDNWRLCYEYWIADLEWLRANAPKGNTPAPLLAG